MKTVFISIMELLKTRSCTYALLQLGNFTSTNCSFGKKNSLTNMIQYKLTKKKSIDLLIFIYILYHMCNSKFNVIVIIMALC